MNLANDPNSLVRKVYYIDDVAEEATEQRSTIELPPAYDVITQDDSFVEQLAFTFVQKAPVSHDTGEERTQEQSREIVKFVISYTSKTVIDVNKQVRTFDAVKDEDTRKFLEDSVVNETLRNFQNLGLRQEEILPVVQKAVDTCVQTLTDKVIPIPRTVVQPFATVKQGFHPFTLDTRNMTWHPGDDTLIGTELKAEGKTFEYDPNFRATRSVDTPENEIVSELIKNDDIDYRATVDLLYSLIGDTKKHFLTYLTEEETNRVMRERQATIAEIIYRQMKEHFFREETSFKASEMRPFSKIYPHYGSKYDSDDIYDLRASLPVSEVPRKVFGGFKKACHTLYKFDSNPERIFAIVLEDDAKVLKWMRPAQKQFDIYYGPGGSSRYEPDFVVETAAQIFLVETKASNRIHDNDVKEKATAAQVYCQAVSEWNAEHSGKPWTYALVAHDEIRLNSSFGYLMDNRIPNEQLTLSE